MAKKQNEIEELQQNSITGTILDVLSLRLKIKTKHGGGGGGNDLAR